MLVPFFLGIEAIPVFYVAHSRDYIRGAFGHGNAVAQLDQPVIIIVIKGSDEVQYPLIIRFRNIRLSDIGMYILFGEGMGEADTPKRLPISWRRPKIKAFSLSMPGQQAAIFSAHSAVTREWAFHGPGFSS